jgi:hypothetical protein
MSVPFPPTAGGSTADPWRFEPLPTPTLAALGIPELPELDLTSYTEDIERIKAGSYTGYDPDHLATATIDGTGLLTRMRLATTVNSRAPQTVERAICAAMAAAQSELNAQWRRLNERTRRYEVPPEYQRLLAEHGVTLDAPGWGSDGS